MATYTDGIHLVSDTEDELHEFARIIGIPRRQYISHKHNHYPLIGNMVNKALLTGAQYKDSRFLVNLKLQALARKRIVIILG